MADPRDSAGPRQRTETQSPAGTLTGWRAANVLRACQSSGATAAQRAADATSGRQAVWAHDGCLGDGER